MVANFTTESEAANFTTAGAATTSTFDFGELSFTTADPQFRENGTMQILKRTWTVSELTTVGSVLWFAIVVTMVGNLSCLYAVWKNLKKILEHPFFQSNVFCVYLSTVDIMMVLFVGVPAAVSYTTQSVDMPEQMYNLMCVDAILDYLVWLQLLLIVAICVDRAGHICRPLTYTFSIKARKTTMACVTCTLVPFIMLTAPFMVATDNAMKYSQQVHNDTSKAFVCLYANNGENEGKNGLVKIYMSCLLKTDEKHWNYAEEFMMWENIANCVTLSLAMLALSVSNGLIVYKLFKSARFQKENKKRQEEVQRSVRMNSIVTLVQVVLILISTVPFRYYQISRRLNDTTFNEFFIVIARVLVFFGGMFNPWLYPIRMASIRAFLVTKKKSVVSSVNTSLLKLRTVGTMMNLTSTHQPLNNP